MNNNKIKWILSIAVFFFVIGVFYISTGNAGISLLKEKEPDNPCGKEFPEAMGFVNDFVHLFTPGEVNTLDSIIRLHENQTTNQIAIITLDSTMLGKCSVDEYTLKIARAWAVGVKGKNNGVVIGIAPSLKQMRIENGYGIEKILSNERTKLIIDSFFISEFRNGNYFKGTKKGLTEIINSIK